MDLWRVVSIFRGNSYSWAHSLESKEWAGYYDWASSLTCICFPPTPTLFFASVNVKCSQLPCTRKGTQNSEHSVRSQVVVAAQNASHVCCLFTYQHAQMMYKCKCRADELKPPTVRHFNNCTDSRCLKLADLHVPSD